MNKRGFSPLLSLQVFFWLNNYNETKFIPNHLTTVIVNDTYVNCVNIRLSLKTKLFLPEGNTKRNDYLVTSPCIEMKIPLCLILLKTKLTNPLGFLCLIFSHWEFAGFKENVLHPKTSLVCNTSATPALKGWWDTSVWCSRQSLGRMSPANRQGRRKPQCMQLDVWGASISNVMRSEGGATTPAYTLVPSSLHLPLQRKLEFGPDCSRLSFITSRNF